MGIEMIQKDSPLGTSSMMETARYQSVLETELARTIIKVQGVQSARVHLALPKPSVFLRDARKATASVMLHLYPGRRLEPGQVAAIVHLVASSVPELAASDVTLVDQAGSLLNFSRRELGKTACRRNDRSTRGSYFRSIVTDCMTTGTTGRSPGLLVLVSPIFRIVSMPSVTSPNTVCLPFR